MHAAAEIDEPFRSFDEPGQQVGREHIDGQHAGVTVGGGAAIRHAKDARVVDDRVHASELVDLLGERAGSGRRWRDRR
jgi:hypothetical protein